jgi:DNA-3-methyladenine glycosylase
VQRDFFDRPAQQVAPDLLGCVLEHETADGLVAVTLTEVEAYAGAADPASHAYRGRTRRNAVMFGPPGHAYVYFTYGMHFCMNVVCLPPGTASAVLLRAGQVVEGEVLARRRRTPASQRGAPLSGLGSEVRSDERRGKTADSGAPEARGKVEHLARGPARLCQALGIDRSLDGADLIDPGSPLRLRAPSGTPPGGERGSGGDATVRSGEKIVIHTGPRVGVREGAEVPWRFWLDGEPTVSMYRAHAPRRRASPGGGPRTPGMGGCVPPISPPEAGTHAGDALG